MSRLTPRSESLLLSVIQLLTVQLEPDIFVQWNTFVTRVQLHHCFFVTASVTRTTLTLSACTGRRYRLTCRRHDLHASCLSMASSVLLQSFVGIDNLILGQSRGQTINTVGDAAAIASTYT
jgi:hypothetical protein